MSNKKYELTKNTKQINGITLYQIKALKDFGNVKKGDLGGWIEKESNLSQEDNCWVYGDAEVSGGARVFDNAEVSDDARVYGNARVSGNAWVYGDAKINTGYAFATKHKNWNITELEMPDGYMTLVKDYVAPKETKDAEIIELNGKKYMLVEDL